MEVAPGIHSLPWQTTTGFLGHFPPNVYLIADGEGVLIDTGLPDRPSVRSRLKYLKEQGFSSLGTIIVTHHHRDHLGGAPEFKRRTGARIALHAQDAALAQKEFPKLTVDDPWQDAHVVTVGGTRLELIHTPGHSPGHACVFLPERRILFSGDHVLGVGTTAINPDEGDMAEYISSLRKLQRYDIDVILPGHGPAIRQAQRKLQELIDHRLEREAQVLGLLKAGKHTVDEMVGEIYPELEENLKPQAQGQVRAHLAKLQKEGQVVALRGGKRFRLAG